MDTIYSVLSVSYTIYSRKPFSDLAETKVIDYDEYHIENKNQPRKARSFPPFGRLTMAGLGVSSIQRIILFSVHFETIFLLSN